MTELNTQTTTAPLKQETACRYCSQGTVQIFHCGLCPRVKAVEYYPNGSVKHVKFKEAITVWEKRG